MADRIGQQLGNYRLLHLLGQGGQASVYLGEHIYLKNLAALKVRHVTLTQQEQTVFLQEAQTLVRLSHPHIVRVLDFALQDGLPFLVMEYAAGGTLRQRHPRGTRLPLDVILPYVKQVASALQYTHDHHLIHRDVKPENMLLSAREEVLLSDFGLVILMPQSLSPEGTEPMEQSLVGTTPYLAPEQLRGKAQVASDQYALAVVVYEWLCGKPPFHGPFLEVAVQQVSAPPPSLREQVPDLSPAIEEVVLHALAKEPEQRFPSVQDFAQALEEAYRPDSLSRPSLSDQSSPSSSEARQAAKPHLPVQPTPFIGREQEVTKACELLSRQQVRLLTLTGPGGIGKTRLSLQVAARLSDHFIDGVYFVNLAPLSDPDLVIPTIAQMLDFKERTTRSMLEQLQAFLQEKQMLLVLDNFEQVVSAASQVADLLLSCPSLKVLVTSREVLHVRAEYEFTVPPLQLPDPKQLSDLASLSQYEAVALFIERAQAVKSEFKVSKATAQAVAEICARLDGLPLAIELAAARSKLFSPQAILARLGQRLPLLTSSTRDVPARQQTLRSTIKWSYDLLTADEQQLFRRLSVFVSGCTLEAAESVSTALGDTLPKVLDRVTSLIDKNLLRQTAQEGEEPRLSMLETIREFGLESLTEQQEMEVTQQVHASYYLQLVEEAEPELNGPQQDIWLERLEREHDNLRAALNFLLEPGEAKESSEMALRLGTSLFNFWLVRSHVREGWTFLERALARSAEVAVPVRAKALSTAGNLAGWLDDRDRAEALCQESLALFREVGDTAELGNAVFNLGVIAVNSGDLAAARSRFEESLSLREVGDKNGIAWSLVFVAIVDNLQGKYTKGRSHAEACLLLFRELGDTWGMAASLLTMAEGFLYEGDAAKAHPLLEECLALNKEIGDKGNEGFVLGALGQVAFLQGDIALARSLLEEGMSNFQDEDFMDTEGAKALTLARLAQVVACEGDDTTARALYEQSLAIAGQVSYQVYTPIYLEGLAGVVAAQGELPWAARLWGAAEALRDTMGAPIHPVYRVDYDQAVAAARAQLGEKNFSAAWAEGRSMTTEQALAARGPVVIPMPALAEPLVSPPTEKSPPTYPDGLTTREVEVLSLVAQGLSNAEIAQQLIISLLTVKAHMRSLYNKLGISSRSAATRYAIEHHLL